MFSKSAKLCNSELAKNAKPQSWISEKRNGQESIFSQSTEFHIIAVFRTSGNARKHWMAVLKKSKPVEIRKSGSLVFGNNTKLWKSRFQQTEPSPTHICSQTKKIIKSENDKNLNSHDMIVGELNIHVISDIKFNSHSECVLI